MTNSYNELLKKHQKMVDEFPMMFAFNEKQFKEGMEHLGLTEHDTDEIIQIGMGGFIRKTDKEAYHKMFNDISDELNHNINNDTTGLRFIKDMFEYELANHEYGYTRDVKPTLDSLGYSVDDIRNDEKLLKGLQSAVDSFE